MTAFLLQYLPIVIFLGISTLIALVFIIASALFAPSAPDPEKMSSYECGFNAFDDARMKFDVRFYLVSILFTWAVSLMRLPHDQVVFAFWSMVTFLGVLTVGFIYEWKKGALEWE